MNDPKVSVIVPIYNAEDFLNRCIDSLVYQTLEDIEILLVDNLSEDNSYSVMKSYEAAFPDKVRAFQLPVHYDGPGAGRNLGLAHAKADYIGFADSDDYFEYDAFKKMYNKAIEEDCDLVYCASYDVKDGKKKLTRALPTGSKEEILTIGSMVFWNKLIRRSLFEKAGKIPEAMVFEDLAYLPQIVSAAKKIGYINEPLYYYIIREDSGVNTLDPDRVLKELDALEYSISQLCGEELDVFLDSVGMRLCNDIRDRWQFTDAYIKEIKKLGPYLVKSKTLLNDKRNWPRVKRYLDLSDDTIPNIVYIPRLPADSSDPQSDEYKSTFFYDGCEVLTLDKNMAYDGELASALLQEKGKLFLNFYLGLCAVHKTGGVYIHPSLKLCAPVNCVKYNEAFFSFKDKGSFSGRIFGCKKGNTAVKRMIDIIHRTRGSLSPGEIIKKVLHEENSIPLNNKTNVYDYIVSVYATPVFMEDVGAKMHMASICGGNKYMEGRKLFRACTVYQLINAINVRLQMLPKPCKADIILTASTDFSVFGKNLEAIGIFDNVIFSDDTTHTNRMLRALDAHDKESMFDNPEKYFAPIHVNGEEMSFTEYFDGVYSDFYISVDDEYSMLIYYYMLNNGDRMDIHIFDESKATYVLDIPVRYKKYGFPHDKYGANQYIKSIREIILYEPELNLAPLFGADIVTLPKIDTANAELTIVYRDIFGYNGVPEEMFIYFEGPFFWDEFVMDDIDVLEEFAKIVGKENIIVKMHPRDQIDRYTCRGFKVMEHSIIPWEITTMLCDLSKKILVTVTSNAVMTGDFAFGLKNKVIQLDKMLTIGHQAEALRQFDSFDDKFVSYVNKEVRHYYRPESWEEIYEVVNYLKGVIKSDV